MNLNVTVTIASTRVLQTNIYEVNRALVVYEAATWCTFQSKLEK